MPKPIRKQTKSGIKYKAEPIYKGRRLGSKQFDTLREANSYQREMILIAEKRGKPTGKTVADALDRYIDEVVPGKKSERETTIRIKKLKRHPIARLKLAAIGHEDIEDWIQSERDRGMKDSSIKREMGDLSQALRYARKWRWMAHNPIELVDKPKAGKPRRRRITQAEIDLICKNLDSYSDPVETLSQEVGIAWLLAIETGMRCGEICAVKIENLHIDRKFVHLEDTKNGDPRDVPLNPEAIRLINRLLADGRSDRLFKVRAATVDTLFRRARGRVGISGLNFHDSRHEAASRMVKAKLYDVLELCAVMGWRDVKMAMVYYNPTAEELAERL